jgi:hypothetical protein
MNMRRLIAPLAIVVILAALASAAQAATPAVFATGFNNPRGIKFGPGGYLYVAEGGVGGTQSTVGQCEQVVPPVGPYTGSPTGARISRISPSGEVSTVVDRLPSSQTSPMIGSEMSGVADISFIHGTLYALIAGAGCSHGVASMPNGVIRIDEKTGAWALVANLSDFYKANPVAKPEEDDFEPDGTSYSMIANKGELYVVEPNHGELDKVSPSGAISRVVDVSATQGHVVPTVVRYRQGSFLLGNLGTFPIAPGTEKIFAVSPAGELKDFATGLTAVLGLALHAGKVYALETSTAAGLPMPGTGRVVEVASDGTITPIAEGLALPTAMTFGPDGALYVSNLGYGGPGAGQILRISLS